MMRKDTEVQYIFDIYTLMINFSIYSVSSYN